MCLLFLSEGFASFFYSTHTHTHTSTTTMDGIRRQHYICTWAATSGEGRRKPAETSKDEFRAMFESAVQSVSTKHYSGSLVIAKAAFVEEQHEPPTDDEVQHSADDLRHFHAAVSFNKLILIKRLAAELRERFSIHAHFSLTHTYWWSCIRYVTQPSEKKPNSAIDKEPLLIGLSKEGLFRESQRSFNTKRSCEKYEEAVARGQAGEAKAPRVSVDTMVNVINHIGLQTEAEVRAFSETRATDAERAFIRARDESGRLANLLRVAKDAKHAEEAAAREKMSAREIIGESATGQCVGGATGLCPWQVAVLELFRLNYGSGALLKVQQLYALIRNGLDGGHSKTSKVPFLIGDSNRGKSFAVEPMERLFQAGELLTTPPTSGSYPLEVWLEGSKKAAFFDEFNPCEQHVAQATNRSGWSKAQQRRFFNGGAITISVRKCGSGTDVERAFRVPTVVTGEDYRKTWRQWGAKHINEQDLDHWAARFEFFEFRLPIPTVRPVPCCPTCFCRAVLHGFTEEFVAKFEEAEEQQVATSQVRLTRESQAAEAGQAAASSSSQPAPASQEERLSARFARLQRIMEWRERGLLDSPEFRRLKEEFFEEQ